jgi:transposase-like protein
MARPHMLADPEKARQVAELFVAGCTRQEIADTMGVTDLETVTRWRRDPRVKAIAHKLIDDRVLQITRKVDGVIAERLEHTSEMTVRELLDIRKEFLGGKLRQRTEDVDDGTTMEALEAIEGDEDFMDKVERLFQKEAAKDA